jgi:hypothetical protein
MAIAFGASLGTPVNDVDNSLTTIAMTGVTVPSGARVVVNVSWYNAGVTASMGSSGGLTWTNEVQVDGVSDTARHAAEFSAHAPAGLSSATLTCTFSGGAFGRSIQGFYATGLDTTTSAKDVSATGRAAGAGGGGTLAWATGSNTTTVADTLLSGFCWYDAVGTSSTPAVTTPTTTEVTDANNNAGSNNAAWVQQYRILTATGSNTMAGTWAFDASGEYLALMVAYKIDAGGGGGGSTAFPALQVIRSNIRIGP